MIDRARALAALALALVTLASPIDAGESDSSADWYVLEDSAGVPVAAARVAVVGRTGSVSTGPDGRFRLDPEPSPPFDLAVFDVRGTFLGVVRIEGSATQHARRVVLPEAPSADVEVRAGIAPSTAASPAASATLVSRSELDRTNPGHVVDVLKEIPGTGRLEEGASGVPVLRGMARGRTLVLIDDARVTTERRAGPSATFLDPASIESVEVVLGPGSVAYGSDAIGGVVHARTPSPTPGSTFARYDVGGGAGTPYAAALVEGNLPAGQGALLVQARGRDADDYDAPSGTIPNSGSQDRGFLLRGLHPAGGATLQWGARVDDARDIGKPATDSLQTRAYYPREDSTRLNFDADFGARGSFSSIALHAFAGQYRLVTIRDRAVTEAAPRRVQQSDVGSDDASLRLVATRPFASGFVRFGLDGAARLGLEATTFTEFYDATGAVSERTDETPIESADRFDTGVFAEGEHATTRRLSLAGGLRADAVRTQNDGGVYGTRSRSEGTFSGHATAIVRSLDGALEGALQIARGFREPSLSDLYYVGVTGRGIAYGNPELDPETSLHADLAFRARVGRTHLAAHAYRFRIDDLIERYQEGDDFFFRNRGRATVQGVEVEAAIRIAERFTARVAASALRGRIEDDGSPAADIPPHRLVAGVEQEIGRWWWRASVVATARKDDPGPVEVATAGWTTFDLGAGIALAPAFSLRLTVLNVLDKEYTATPDPTAVAAPGRSAGLTLAGTFGAR